MLHGEDCARGSRGKVQGLLRAMRAREPPKSPSSGKLGKKRQETVWAVGREETALSEWCSGGFCTSLITGLIWFFPFLLVCALTYLFSDPGLPSGNRGGDNHS